jgi:hypothetical protein
LATNRRPGSSSKKDIGELLPISVAHDEAGVVEFFNRPGWRKSGSPMFFKEVKDEIDDEYCASYLQ